MERLWQDIRVALRILRANPGFAATAVLAIALGIGANAAIFSVVNAVLFKPLPYSDPERLVTLETRNLSEPAQEAWTSGADFHDIVERARSFDAIAGISAVWNLAVTLQGDAERIESLYVSASLFPLLGVQPAHGRTFRPDEDLRDRPKPVLMLSHAYWMRRFGGDPAVIGQAITVAGQPWTIIGVLPEDFRFVQLSPAQQAANIELWLPLAANEIAGRGRPVRFLKTVARLKPGVTLPQADAEMASIGRGLAAQYPDSNGAFAMSAASLRERTVGALRPAMLVLLAVVGCVLLIACANVANLLLARAAARAREIAVRSALGASAARLARQFLTESLVLSILGSAAGLALGALLVRAVIALAPTTLPRKGEIGLDWQVVVFTLAAAVITGLIAGFAPAARLLSAGSHDSLRAGARNITGIDRKLRGALVVGEVALATALLIASGLLIRSFSALLGVHPGFEASRLVTLSTQAPATVRTPLERLGFYQRIEEKLQSLPGVESVAAVSRLPLLGQNLGSHLVIEGRPRNRGEKPDVEYRVATENYFATMGIPLLQGRFFDERDRERPRDVILINQALARRYFPNENPLGRRIQLGSGSGNEPWITIVGVVGDLRHFGIDAEPRPEAYRPFGVNPLFHPIIVVRASRDPERMSRELTAAMRSVHPEAPVFNVFAMQKLVDRSTAGRRFPMLLLTAFAALALVLAATGIFGVISQMAAQRTREIGVRMAVGANPGDVLRMVLGDGLKLAAAGAILGLLLSAASARALRSLLFGITERDAAPYAVAMVVLLAAAVAACAAPAWRASRLDPIAALRED
ncbi:MAG: ABC transporter permease [Bryobacteraceae bacterium]|nr:ABC transporter permease [Bryobacteraceae bacterium]